MEKLIKANKMTARMTNYRRNRYAVMSSERKVQNEILYAK